MGTYIYTMRKREVALQLPSGETEKARLFSYAYKPYLCAFTPKDAARREAQYDAAAGRAYQTYTGGLVIDGDLDKGLAGLDGAYVYRNVTRARWADSSPFPGTPAGIVRVEGGKARLDTAGPWSQWFVGDKPVTRRIILKDGQFQEETREEEPPVA